MQHVYLLISGDCEYDAHEAIIAVCASVDAAKARAERFVEERAAFVETLPPLRGRPPRPCIELRWHEECDGEWTEVASRYAFRIEPWGVEEG